MNEELPPGAEVPPTIVSLDMGSQCKGCTHYKEEHLEGFEHCAHIMYYLPIPEDLKPWEKSGRVIKPRKLCDCKKFVNQDAKAEIMQEFQSGDLSIAMLENCITNHLSDQKRSREK